MNTPDVELCTSNSQWNVTHRCDDSVYRQFVQSVHPRNKKSKPGLKNKVNSRHTDFITQERLRDIKLKRSNRDKWYKQNIQTSQTEWLENYDTEGDIDRDNLFAHEMDEELQRKDFEEFIILQSTNTVQMSHSYFKIVKLFRYINILNPQGAVIALLSLNRYVKRNSEVVQAVEECDGIVMLLNLMECKIVSVQLAAMKLLSNLFQLMYFRRMAITYGAVQVLVDLLSGSNDHIKNMASDLLSSLALLKEARSIISKTKGIQHLVCLLDLNAPKRVSDDEHKRFKSSEQQKIKREPTVRKESHLEEDAAREESVLVSVATALWRFSRSAVNRTLMQRSGLMLTLTRLIRTKNEKILVPVLGILQGCAADATFRLSIRIEGILKYLIDHLQTTDSRVQMQCCRTIYYCVDDERMQDAIRLLGGLQTLTSILKKQTAGAYKLIQAGWIDTEDDPRTSTTGNSSNSDQNNNSRIQDVIVKSTQLSAEPVHEVRVARLRMTGPRSEPGTATTQACSSDCEEGMLLFHILHTVLATIHKCSGVEQNLVVLNNLGAADCFIKLVGLLTPYLLTFRQPSCTVSLRLQKVALLERVSGLNISCLARMCTMIKVHKMLVSNATVLNGLMQLLGHTSKDILIPTINSIAAMMTDSNLVQMFNQRSGFRILYSLSFHSDIQVRQAALLAVRAFLQSVPDRAVLLRPINSSLGFMVQSLSSVYRSLVDEARKPPRKSETLLSAICAVLAEIASDDQGRAILTELGAVPYLVNITTIAKEDCLRIGVSAAITQFAATVPMIRAFREKEFLASLIEYVRVDNLELRLNAVKALDKLSMDPVICAAIRSTDITSVFLRIMCDAPQELQAAAAHVIGRVARLSVNSLRNAHLST
ncbi:Armadillo repeat-containing protein 4 [Paragonimus westermani]|uniref:Armadillo repeat-containing protein 4 n=1 Tax=Paragonimus westermani TaxID=34504 RepID=A0A8T0DGR5_9TREM|nr:Armadillo repeat-containing protein 4 [Paragonimus westermani]